CMKLVDDMATHLRVHQVAFNEVNRFPLLPVPYTAH
uniref:Uncharacterized protein n=1 Tax=Panagrolaimus sp. ES5 TaxID=591445 RepID=A0AC34FFD5_9BILA